MKKILLLTGLLCLMVLTFYLHTTVTGQSTTPPVASERRPRPIPPICCRPFRAEEFSDPELTAATIMRTSSGNISTRPSPTPENYIITLEPEEFEIYKLNLEQYKLINELYKRKGEISESEYQLRLEKYKQRVAEYRRLRP